MWCRYFQHAPLNLRCVNGAWIWSTNRSKLFLILMVDRNINLSNIKCMSVRFFPHFTYITCEYIRSNECALKCRIDPLFSWIALTRKPCLCTYLLSSHEINHNLNIFVSRDSHMEITRISHVFISLSLSICRSISFLQIIQIIW